MGLRNEQEAKPVLSRSQWVSAARTILIASGIESVKVRKISEKLGVTTGAFYYIYKNLEELHGDLLMDWRKRNTAPFTNAVEETGSDGRAQLLALGRVIMLEEDYDSAYDNAIRGWAHKSCLAREALEEINRYRIDLISSMFETVGFDRKSARVRSKVYYFHQVGYQALRVDESVDARLRNAPYYSEILTGGIEQYPFDDPTAVRKMLMDVPLNKKQA
jgi:AcrR family transcriptional regulator